LDPVRSIHKQTVRRKKKVRTNYSRVIVCKHS